MPVASMEGVRQTTEITGIDRPLHTTPYYEDSSYNEVRSSLPHDSGPVGTLIPDDHNRRIKRLFKLRRRLDPLSWGDSIASVGEAT